MATVAERMTVTVTPDQAMMVREVVEGGEYVSASEVVREALREWSRGRDQERRDLETLREAVRIGDESGDSIPAEQVFAEMRQIIAKARATRG